VPLRKAIRQWIYCGPLANCRHIIACPKVVEPRLGVTLLAGKALLGPAAERPAGHEEPPRVVVVALDHRTPFDHGPRAAEQVRVVVLPVASVRLPAHHAPAREHVEVVRDDDSTRIHAEDPERGRAI